MLYLPFLSRAEALYSDKEATPFSSKGLSIKKLEGKLSVVIKTKDVSAGVSLSPAIVCRRYEAGTKGCSPVYASEEGLEDGGSYEGSIPEDEQYKVNTQ